jgi:alpha-glucosidase
MYFHKYPHIANFKFAATYKKGQALRIGKAKVRFSVERYTGDIFRLHASGNGWGPNRSQANLNRPAKSSEGDALLEIGSDFGLKLTDERGRSLLTSTAGHCFGLSGKASAFVFEHRPSYQYYGMGEKTLGLELSGVSTKFWNTDVMAEFHPGAFTGGRPDPFYASIPYLIIKQGNTYIGLLLDNPSAPFMSTGAGVDIEGKMKVDSTSGQCVVIGAEHGRPDLYIIVGPDLRSLTRKLQALVGRTPLPPVWALGYHQSRWGYKSDTDLLALDAKMREHGIPCDGLWLDIDYMQDFKVFSINKTHLPRVKQTLKTLKENGRRVVPIIDPGVKREDGYDVCEEGRKADIFCHNPAGEYFIGLVWPGETYFPDFSLPEARQWWAERVAAFAQLGFEGVWIDMNDPSTGPVDATAMLFNRGKLDHHVYHNQYALGMARATRAGLAAGNKGKRVFVLSRSAYTGMAGASAVWHGDSMSNYHHLHMAIPMALNLALSGVPFNGPDVGGFGGDVDARLLEDWQKACFLFPFCRNHTAIGTREQEPWTFGKRTLRVLQHYIRLRYKFRPYLYNLFIEQAQTGEALLRPLFYEFKDTKTLPLGEIEDEFMVGPSILHAPLVDGSDQREVVLPGRSAWYSALDAKWLAPKKGARRVKGGAMQTPLYFREGAILPLAKGETRDNIYKGEEVEYHLFLHKNTRGRQAYSYRYDDGESLDYVDQGHGEHHVTAQVRRGVLHIETEQVAVAGAPCRPSFVLYDAFDEVRLDGRKVSPRRMSWRLAGVRQPVWVC